MTKFGLGTLTPTFFMPIPNILKYPVEQICVGIDTSKPTIHK